MNKLIRKLQDAYNRKDWAEFNRLSNQFEREVN